MRKLHLLIYTVFSVTILMLTLITVTAAMLPAASLAQNQGGAWVEPDLQVDLPSLKFDDVTGVGTQTVTVYWLANYLGALFKLGIGATGILAVVMIMIGGLLWLTAAGKSGQIDQGKTMIYGAITGLFIAMFSYIILLTINPAFVNMKGLTIPVMDKSLPTQWCEPLATGPYAKDVTLMPAKGACGDNSTITTKDNLQVVLNLPSNQCTWSGCSNKWENCNIKTKQCISCDTAIDNVLIEMGLTEGQAGCDIFSPTTQIPSHYERCMFTEDWDNNEEDDTCVKVSIDCSSRTQCQDYDTVIIKSALQGTGTIPVFSLSWDPQPMKEIEDIQKIICPQNPCNVAGKCKVESGLCVPDTTP